MTTSMIALADFLLARIAEDEDSVSAYYGGRPPVETGLEHADPARVLADCEAKRRIAELHRPFASGFGDMRICSMDEGVEPCETLRALASTYADHPDFRDEWR